MKYWEVTLIKLIFLFVFALPVAFADCDERFTKYQKAPVLIFDLITNAKQICEIKGQNHQDCKAIVKKGHETISTFTEIGLDLEKECKKNIPSEEFISIGYQLGVLQKNLNKFGK